MMIDIFATNLIPIILSTWTLKNTPSWKPIGQKLIRFFS